MELTRLKSSSASIRSAYSLFSSSSDQLGAHSSLAAALSFFAPALCSVVALPIDVVSSSLDVRTSLRDALSVASVAISAPGSLSPLLRSDLDADVVRTANSYKDAAEEVLFSVVSKCLGSGHSMAIFRVLQVMRSSDGAADASGLFHLEKILFSSYRLLKPLQPTLLIALTDAALSLGSTHFLDAFRLSAGPQYSQDSSSMLSSIQKTLEGLVSQSLFEMTLVKDFPKGFNPQPDTVLSAIGGGIDDVGILHNEGFDVDGITHAIALNITSLLRLHDAALTRGQQCPVLASTTLQNVWICLPHAMPTAICERQYQSKEIGRILTQSLYSSWLEDASDLLSVSSLSSSSSMATTTTTTSSSTSSHNESNGLKQFRLSNGNVIHKRQYVPVAYAALTRLVFQIVNACDGLCPQAPRVSLSNFVLNAELFTHVLSSKFPVPCVTNPAWTDALFVYPMSEQQQQTVSSLLSKQMVKTVAMSKFFFKVAAKTLAPLASLSLQSGARVHPAVKEMLINVIHLVRGVFYLSFAPINRVGSPLQEECRRGENSLSELAFMVLKPLLLTVDVNSGREIGEGACMDSEACSELSWELFIQMLTESVNAKRPTYCHQSFGSLLLSLRILSDMFTLDTHRSSNSSFSRNTDKGLFSLISLIPALFETSARDIQMNNDLHSAYNKSNPSASVTFLNDIPNHIVESLRPFIIHVVRTGDSSAQSSTLDRRGTSSSSSSSLLSSLDAETFSQSAMFAILLRFSLNDSYQQRDIGNRLWAIVIQTSLSLQHSTTSSLSSNSRSSIIVSSALRILIDAGHSAGDQVHRARAGTTLSRLIPILDQQTIIREVISVILPSLLSPPPPPPPPYSSTTTSTSSSSFSNVKHIISSSSMDLFSSNNRLAFLTSFFESLDTSQKCTGHFIGHASFLFNSALNVVTNSAVACNIDAPHRRLYRKLLTEGASLASSCSKVCLHSISQEEADAALSAFFQVVQATDPQNSGAGVIIIDDDELSLFSSFLRLRVRCINRERTDLVVILNLAQTVCRVKGTFSKDILQELFDSISETILEFFKIMLDRPKADREPVRVAIFNCLRMLVDRDDVIISSTSSLTSSSTLSSTLSSTSSLSNVDNPLPLGLKTTATCLAEVALRLLSKSSSGSGMLPSSENERAIKLQENIERASGEILQSSGLDMKKWSLAKDIALKIAVVETR
jgi:hypothetical protein